MMYQGIDTAVRIGAEAAKQMKTEGYDFAGRYLVPETYGKALTAAEARDLLAAGLAILPIWETAADRAKRGAAAGAKDGALAADLAQKLGIPAGTAIYYAVDYPPTPDEYDAIALYFRAAQIAALPYCCGIYGPYGIVEEIKRRLPELKVWQCVAWSGGKISDKADVYQYQWQGGAEAKALAAQLGFAVDLNQSKSLEGMWVYMQYEDGDGVIVEPVTQQTPARPWYADAMDWAERSGLIRDGRPNDFVTRAELAMVLQRLCEGKELDHDPDYDRPSGLISD